MGAKEIFFGAIMFVFGGFLFWKGFKKYGQYKLIKDTPTSKVRSLAMGIVEVHGQATDNEKAFIKSPFSQEDCFLYKYEVKEYRKHTSGGGKNRRTYYSWDTIATGRNEIPFRAKDDTGEVVVNPQYSELNINLRKVFLQKASFMTSFAATLGAIRLFDNNPKGVLDVNKFNLIPIDITAWTFGSRVGDRRYYEYYIANNDDLFVLGTATNDASTNNKVEIKKGENEKTFIISDKSEKELLKKMGWSITGLIILGVVLILSGLWLVLSSIGIS